MKSVLKRWPTVLALTLIGVLLAVAAIFLVPQRYASSVVLYISSQGAADDTTAQYQGSLLSEQRVKSYAELLPGLRVTTGAVRQARVPLTPEELGERITVEFQPDTVVMTVRVTDTSPQSAAMLANAVAGEFTRLVGELERPVTANRAPAVVARTVQPASEVPDRVEPRPVLYVALGILFGVLIGAGVAFARSRLDQRIRSLEELTALTDAPGLGETPRFEPGDGASLFVNETKHRAAVESFRVLRTNIAFVQIDSRSKVLHFTSSSSGEGKSTTVINLAAALSSLGHSVLIVEGDLRRPSVSASLGVERSVGITSVLSQAVALRDAVQKVASIRADVLSSGGIPPNPSELLGSQAMVALLDEARRLYTYVLVDSAPVLPVADGAMLASLCDCSILIARYGTSTRRELEQSVNALQAVSATVAGVVLTMGPERRSGRYGYGHAYLQNAEAAEQPAAVLTPAVRRNGAPPPASRHSAEDTTLQHRLGPHPSRQRP